MLFLFFFVSCLSSFLRHSRMFASIPSYLVSQRQTLAEYAASNSIDQQLSRHFKFVNQNHRIDTFEREVQRIVKEHHALLENATGATHANRDETNTNEHTNATTNAHKRTSPNDHPPNAAPGRHARRSSLVLMYGSDSVPSSSSVAGSSHLPGGLSSATSATMAVELEIPQHKLHALYMMRVLRLRELRARIQSHLNYFRSVQKVLIADECIYAIPATSNPKANARYDFNLHRPTAVDGDGTARIPASVSLEDRKDEWSFDSSQPAARSRTGAPTHSEHIIVRDARKKVRIIYDAAINDLAQLDTELLSLASMYIDRHQYVGMGMKGEVENHLAAYQTLITSLDGSIVTNGATGNINSAKQKETIKEEEQAEQFYPDPLLISSKSEPQPPTARAIEYALK